MGPEATKCPKRRRSIPGAAAPILTMQVIAPFPVGCRVGWSVDPLRFGHSGPHPQEFTLRASSLRCDRACSVAMLQCFSFRVPGLKSGIRELVPPGCAHPPHRVEVDILERGRRWHRRPHAKMSISIVTDSRARAVHTISTQIMVSKKYNTFMIRENA